MSPVSFLGLLFFGACLGQLTVGYRIGSTAKGLVSLASDVATLGADTASQVVNSATTTSEQVMNNVESLGTSVLEGGTQLAHKGLAIVDRIGKNIPVVRLPLIAATSFARWLTSSLNNAGQQALKVGTGIGKNVANYANQMTQLTTDSIKKFATDGSQQTSNAIDRTVNILDELYNTLSQNSQTGQGQITPPQGTGTGVQDPTAGAGQTNPDQQ